MAEVNNYCVACGKEISLSDSVCSKCGEKTMKVVGKTLNISYDAILVRGPQKYLTDMLSQNRLIEGIVVSVMFFEHYGTEKLKAYFKSKSVPIEPLKIDEMKVGRLMSLLEGFGLIDCGTHSKIGEVIKERNDVVHKLDFPDSINESKLRETIAKALDCLRILGAP